MDRLTILELKILHGKAAGKGVTHFEDEHTLLFEQFWQGANNFRPVFERALQLAAVNAALWAAEDDLRHYGTLVVDMRPDQHTFANWQLVAETGLRIQQLNDQRAALVAQINTLAGDSAPAEKL